MSKKNNLPLNYQNNLDELEALGIVPDGQGGYALNQEAFQGMDAEPNELSPVVITKNPDPVVVVRGQEEDSIENLPGDDPADPVENIPKPKTEEKQLDGTDWEKRKKDAQEEQRKLSKTQTEVKKALAELSKKMEEFDKITKQTSEAVARKAEAMHSLGSLDAYREDFPEVVSAIEAALSPVYGEIQGIMSRLHELENGLKTQSEYFHSVKEKDVFDKVFSVIPKNIVDDIVYSDEFNKWLDNLPPKMSKDYKEIIYETSRFTADDAIAVLKQYARDSGYELNPGSKKKAVDPVIPKDSAPVLKGGNALPQPVKRDHSSAAKESITPLSIDEMMNFESLLQNSRTNAERDLLRKRLEATENISI